MIDPVEFGKQIGALIRDATAPLLARIEELEKRQPEKGERGADGAPGRDADPVDLAGIVEEVLATLLSGDRLKTLVDTHAGAAVEEYFEANPVRHGRDGAEGAAGPQGDKGETGATGRDGVGLADALIDRDGNLVLTMTDGRAKQLGTVVGADGERGQDGRDGVDGISFDSACGAYDAERGFVITLAGAGRQTELVLPYMVHRGFWREGIGMKAGQSATHDGALWIAKRDTAAKPCLENAEDWILAARKGRDGRDGKDGKPPPGPVKLGGGDGA